MNTSKVTKERFSSFFNYSMRVKHTFGSSMAENGRLVSEIIPIEPALVIRDFSIESYPDCDSEFTNLEDAYRYFLEVGSYCRIMDASGRIHADYWGGDSE